MHGLVRARRMARSHPTTPFCQRSSKAPRCIAIQYSIVALFITLFRHPQHYSPTHQSSTVAGQPPIPTTDTDTPTHRHPTRTPSDLTQTVPTPRNGNEIDLTKGALRLYPCSLLCVSQQVRAATRPCQRERSRGLLNASRSTPPSRRLSRCTLARVVITLLDPAASCYGATLRCYGATVLLLVIAPFPAVPCDDLRSRRPCPVHV